MLFRSKNAVLLRKGFGGIDASQLSLSGALRPLMDIRREDPGPGGKE